MGSDGSKLPPKDVKDLKKSTSFSGQEIRDWFRKFRSDYPSGFMTKDDFQNMYAQTFPSGDATAFADQVFRVYDANKDGHIDFREFMCTLSVSARGSIDEKLRWAFSLYDQDQNGYVERDEAAQMVSAILKMRGLDCDAEADRLLVEQTVEQIFEHLDKNNDNKLSQMEFVLGAKRSPTVLGILQNS